MTSEKFETLIFDGAEGMHGSIFLDLFYNKLPGCVKVKEPDTGEQSRRVQISNIPSNEVKRVIRLIRENGGEIIEN